MTNFEKISEELKKMEETQINPKELMFFIYENHEFFFLNYLEEDYRYDFILSLFPLLERIADSFDKKKASLEQYLRFIISRNRKTWKKKLVQNQIKEVLIEREYKFSINSDLMQENETDFDSCYSDNIEEYTKLPERLIKILPVLAYRASAYITNEQISKISRISNINEEEMFRVIHILNERLESRINNVKKITQRKTSAYLKRCCYSFEKNLLSDSDSIRYEKVNEKLISTQKHYEKSLATQNSTQIVTPSWLIAEVLGVSVYNIDNKLRYVHKLFPDFFKKKNQCFLK